MNSRIWIGGLGLAVICVSLYAGIPEPDAIVYGPLVVGGRTIPGSETTTEVFARVVGRTQKIGSYLMGSHQAAENRYVLRLKLESVPTGAPARSADAALIGETAQIFVKQGTGPERSLRSFRLTDRGVIQQLVLHTLDLFGFCISGPASTSRPGQCSAEGFDAGDYDGDDDVDLRDFALFQNQVGQS